jgi:hypothetical protein
MTRLDDETFDPAERAAEKQRARDEDASALAAGDKTVEELQAENEVFARLAPRAWVNLRASESLG